MTKEIQTADLRAMARRCFDAANRTGMLEGHRALTYETLGTICQFLADKEDASLHRANAAEG